MSKVTSATPAFFALCTTLIGNAVGVPTPPRQQEEIEGAAFLHAIVIPSATAGNIDHVNGTSSGWSYIRVEKSAANSMNGGKFLCFTGKKKDGATTSLLNNKITISINGVDIAEIQVDADTQTVGWHAYSLPGDREDARFVLNGVSTTGDLVFAMTTADPALELHLLIIAND